MTEINDAVMMLHPMTWFHLATGLSEATTTPMPVITCIMVAQRLLGDTLTHPLVYVMGVVAVMMLYRSMGIASGGDIVIWPIKDPEATIVRLFAYMVPCLLEIVWSDRAGLLLIMLASRAVDVVLVSTQPDRRVAWYKIIMYIPLYLIWIAGAVSTQPLAYRVTRLLVICMCVVYVAYMYLMQWYYGRVAWLRRNDDNVPTTKSNVPKGKSKIKSM